ncbi:MAG: cyclic nucleotide-binding domain-containing protein [Pseudomonadota bacterium]
MTVHCLSETRQLLLGLRLFRGLVEKDLATLLYHAELVECATRDYVIREGEQEHHLFVLINGKVDISKRAFGIQKTIQTLGPGECFGEMSLIECRSRSASVRAAMPCKLLRINGEEIDRLPEVAAKLYRNIAIMLSQRLRSANEMLALGS